MSLSLWTRLLNWRKIRSAPVPKVLFATIADNAPSVVQAASVDTLITARFQAFEGTVTPAVSGLPSGVSGAFTPTTLGAGVNTTTLRLTATGGATPVVGDAFTVTLTPADTTVQPVTLNCTCTVVASVSASISISATPTATSALQGEADTSSVVTLVRTAYTGDVTLSASGLPTGATATFSPNPLTGGVLTSIVTVTNDIAASTVTNDAWSIDATGSGVSPASQAMTHTITSPNVTRGVPTAGHFAGDQFAYANQAAFVAANPYGNSAQQLQNINVDTARTHDGHKVMGALLSTTEATAYCNPPYITKSFTATNSVFVYVALGFDAGWTTRGSATGPGIGQTYKIWALNYGGANGRTGIEYTGGSTLSLISVLTGGSSAPVVGSYTNNITGLTTSGAGGAWGAGVSAGKNYTTDTVWAAGGTVCFGISMERIDANDLRVKYWTWQFGSEPPTSPLADITLHRSSGSWPTINRIALGENFGQPRASRYAPQPCYHYWSDWRVWDLSTHPNPCNLE